MVELVVTMMILGIVAVVAMPRFMGRAGFDARGFFDQVVTAVQYARQQAVAQRRQVCVAVNAGGILTITRAQAVAGACNTALLNPNTGAAYALTLPDGVALVGHGGTVLPLALNFSPLGRPSAAAELQVSGEENRCLRIEAETGYVRTIAC